MPQFFPLFLPNVLLDFVPKEEVERDSAILRNYFEGGEPSKVIQLLDEQNSNWKEYLEKLAEPRRLIVFDSAKAVPDEEIKLAQLMKDGKPIVNELQLIKSTSSMSRRTWPLEKLEAKKKDYLEAKSIPYPESGELEQHLSWIISNALAEIYFPDDFFASMIFKLEPEYSGFPYEFPEDFLGAQQLYIWYLIYTKKGPEHFFKNLEDVIIQRYRITRMLSMSAYSLLNFFMCNGNDRNGCNRFFTRRMKDDIDEEISNWCTLVNQIGLDYEETSFKEFFMSDPSSNCNIKDPFQKQLKPSPGLIEQSIYNHLIGNYSAAVNLLFPIIEGICWDISVAEHLVNGRIFSTDSDLKTRDLKKR